MDYFCLCFFYCFISSVYTNFWFNSKGDYSMFISLLVLCLHFCFLVLLGEGLHSLWRWQVRQLKCQHSICWRNKYRIHTLTVGVKLHFLTGFGLLMVCCKKIKAELYFIPLLYLKTDLCCSVNMDLYLIFMGSYHLKIYCIIYFKNYHIVALF